MSRTRCPGADCGRQCKENQRGGACEEGEGHHRLAPCAEDGLKILVKRAGVIGMPAGATLFTRSAPVRYCHNGVIRPSGRRTFGTVPMTAALQELQPASLLCVPISLDGFKRCHGCACSRARPTGRHNTNAICVRDDCAMGCTTTDERLVLHRADERYTAATNRHFFQRSQLRNFKDRPIGTVWIPIDPVLACSSQCMPCELRSAS